jgi:hypothetical protein
MECLTVLKASPNNQLFPKVQEPYTEATLYFSRIQITEQLMLINSNGYTGKPSIAGHCSAHLLNIEPYTTYNNIFATLYKISVVHNHKFALFLCGHVLPSKNGNQDRMV